MANRDLKTTIQWQNLELLTRYDNNDMDGLKNLFTEDCKIWVGGSDDTLYKQDDVPRLLRAARAGGAKYKRETDEVGPPGTDGTVYERGRFLAIGPDGSSSVSSAILASGKK
ncbi:uncharacterized protein LOC117295769 isoform X2 [Asterias rubens]|uniref:uncharacterized protein LOC117295769 isoform X2 n=1 Tax=Asterias rubens TaxID=7604 RepID=UPI00145569ED|nr:uncharacterized protein LOC117295769 isoform X2 [Asterias rubens]